MKTPALFFLLLISAGIIAGNLETQKSISGPETNAGQGNLAPASPARWTLAPHIAPRAADPRRFLGMGDVLGEAPLPHPCGMEQARDGKIIEIQTSSVKGDVATVTVLNAITDLGWRGEYSAVYDKDGRLKKTTGIASEGDKGSCEFSYDSIGRRIKDECGNSCNTYHYDEEERLVLIRESMSGCGDWNSFARYSYTGANTIPATVKYCIDDIENCYGATHVTLDRRGFVTRLERIEGEDIVSVETLTYDERGLLIAAKEVDNKGEVTTKETFTYDAAGEKLLTIGFTGRKTKYTKTFSYNCRNSLSYTADKFFEDVEARYIATEDEISVAQKAAIVESGFNRGREVCDDLKGSPDVYYESWYVAEKKDAFLKLGRCGTGSTLQVHLYKHKHGGSVVAVVSLMGNHGQSQEFRFFRVSQNGRIVKEMTLEALGIRYPKENEFLAPSQQLPEDQNERADLYINGDGAINVAPMTWMQPRWEHRTIANDIWFEWDEEKFIKRMKKSVN